MISLLHVDRDENYLQAAKQYLANHGHFRIHSVTSARDALEILKTETFDAIVADCMVPDPEGIALLDSVRLQGNMTPFIIHTATTRGSAGIDAVNHGASFYLVKGKKPVPVFARLQTVVEQAVVRHRADEEIRKIAKMPEQNPGPVMRISRGGVLVYANPASADLLAKWGMKVGMAVTPDISTMIRNVLHNKSEAVIEETVGGSVYLLTFSPVPGEDSVNIYGKNITERRRAQSELEKSEARLNEAQRLAQIGSWTWDFASDTMSWSDELYAITGKDPAVPLPGHADRLKMYTPESAERLEHAMSQSIKTGNPYTCELEFIRGDGEHRWCIARGSAVCNGDGRVQALTGLKQHWTRSLPFPRTGRSAT
jgi:PAS domain-containing protein